MKTVFGLVWVLVITACLPGCRTDAQVTDAQVTEPVAAPIPLRCPRAPLAAALLLQEKLLSQQQTNNARDFEATPARQQ